MFARQIEILTSENFSKFGTQRKFNLEIEQLAENVAGILMDLGFHMKKPNEEYYKQYVVKLM